MELLLLQKSRVHFNILRAWLADCWLRFVFKLFIKTCFRAKLLVDSVAVSYSYGLVHQNTEKNQRWVPSMQRNVGGESFKCMQKKFRMWAEKVLSACRKSFGRGRSFSSTSNKKRPEWKENGLSMSAGNFNTVWHSQRPFIWETIYLNGKTCLNFLNKIRLNIRLG